MKVVIREIIGLVEHAKDVANSFASKGYVALAPNLYSRDPILRSVFIPKYF